MSQRTEVTCNRCGAVEVLCKPKEEYSRVAYNHPYGLGWNNHEVDLCRKCYKDFCKFLKNK